VAIRETSDAGTPIVASQPAGEAAAAYVSVAERVWAKLQEADARREEGKGK
jgi:ATP-binding protein involved in chromosome partitioning